MSEVYEVKHVSGPKEWQGSHGPMLSYKLDLDNNGVLERQVELNRKPESRAPAVGELLALDLEETNYGTKAKLDFDRTKELSQPTLQTGSQETSTGSTGGWQPESERDPERAARILRQHSQEMAIRAIDLKIRNGGKLEKDLDQALTDWADWFDQDVLGQSSRQAQGSSGSTTQVGGAPPLGAFPASDQGSVEHRHICEALDTAGLTYAGAQTFVADWMLDPDKGLPPERIKRAVGNLVGQDTQLQGETLQALRAEAERATGRLVPVAGDEDFQDLPPASEPIF